jgi:hypothetical protein
MPLSMRSKSTLVAMLMAMTAFACGGNDNKLGPTRKAPVGGNTTSGANNPTCSIGSASQVVNQPVYWKHLSGETSWFAAPLVADLDHDGKRELIAAYYSTFIFDSAGNRLDKIDNDERAYAPHIVADLEGDGTTEIVTGNGSAVYAYEWTSGKSALKPGWPASVNRTGNDPEVRGLAAGDLNGDGSLEIIATTTETAEESAGGAQVWVFNADGSLYQPAGLGYDAWPRYNAARGQGNDADRNGVGQQGYGCYGLNVGVGNIDDDKELEIIVTYDNHQIQAFNHDGVTIDASPWFKNPSSEYAGNRMTWGQFIRWADPTIEANHYNLNTDYWPNPTHDEWLQWTQSPPNIVDLDGDGKNEVLGVPNVELHDPYVTQAWAIMVLQGAYGDGSLSAMRKPGWETLPRGQSPVLLDGWYPPTGVPAAASINLLGDAQLETVVSLNDEFMYAFDASGSKLWQYNYSHGKPTMFASEPIVADLNQDGSPEVLFTTFGAPDELNSGNLVILAANGSLLFDIPLPNEDQSNNGNGNGAPAAPTVADLDGNGTLEIFIQTFEHGMDVYTVPGSAENCLLWPTARGGPLRMGQPSEG